MPSGTIAEAGKSQPLTAVNGSRRGLSVQNNSDADLRILQGGVDASASNGFRVAAGGYYETPQNRYSGGSWSIWGATAGQAFDLQEW